jgi:dTMP kinase
MAYQGAGYGNDLDEMRRLQSFATGGLRPDLTILLDVPVEVGLERTRRRKEWNRFEDTEEVDFFERVRAAYMALADDEPERFRIVDGAGTVADSDEAIRTVVAAAFGVEQAG